MSHNREAIIALCSTLCPRVGVAPLTYREYRDLAQILFREGKEPGDLYDLSTADADFLFALSPFDPQRLLRLLDRSEDLMKELASYEARGISVITRAEAAYPRTLRITPGSQCPPLLYYAGDLALAQRPLAGYVGSREIDAADSAFGASAVKKTLSKGYGVVSGGARGSDSVAEGTALSLGGFVVEYPAVSLLGRLRDPSVARSVAEGKLLLLFPAAPHTGFSTPLAMMRNRYIYAHSHGTVIIRSHKGRGGTWSGAKEALKKKLCPLLCHNTPHEGNQALIQAGALPIDHTWSGHFPQKTAEDRTEGFAD